MTQDRSTFYRNTPAGRRRMNFLSNSDIEDRYEDLNVATDQSWGNRSRFADDSKLMEIKIESTVPAPIGKRSLLFPEHQAIRDAVSNLEVGQSFEFQRNFGSAVSAHTQKLKPKVFAIRTTDKVKHLMRVWRLS